MPNKISSNNLPVFIAGLILRLFVLLFFFLLTPSTVNAATFFSDNFDVSSSVTLGSRVPNIGTSWSILINNASTLHIYSNSDHTHVLSNGTNSGALYKANGSYTSADYQVTSIVTYAGGDTEYTRSMAARIQDANNMYLLRYSLSVFQIYKRTAGAWSLLGSGNTYPVGNSSAPPYHGDTVGLKVQGNQISGLINGNAILTVTDNDHSAAGTAGLGTGYVNITTDDAGTGMGTDNFIVQDVDPNAPIISGVSSSPSSNSAVFIWSTDEISSSQIEYGLLSSYGSSTVEADTTPRVTNHSVTVSSLLPCVRYYYRVKSTDSNSNQGVSASTTFRTTGCSASSISSGSENSVPTSGGTITFINGQSTARIIAPNNYTGSTATIQLNKLDSTSVPISPSGTSLVKENFYDLVAISGSNTLISSFNQPVSFVITYGEDAASDYQESSMDIYKYTGGSWVDQNCTLDTNANTLTCSLPSFSTYGVFGTAVSGISSSSSATSSSPTCSSSISNVTPDLFQINTTQDNATIYFTPIPGNTKYYIAFSTKNNAEEHGVLATLGSEGVQNLTINLLSPNTNYYFKVRGDSGCTPGNWSNIRSTRTKSYLKTTAITEDNLTKSPEKEKQNIQTQVPAKSTNQENEKIVDKKPNIFNRLAGEVKTKISNRLFSIGQNIQNISNSIGYGMVDLGYKLIDEPTKIYEVKTAILSPTSAKISWKTNQPANGKVNYGLDKTYQFDVQSHLRTLVHEFTLTDLQADTLYYFEIMSQAKTYVYDANREFKTPQNDK